MSYDGIFWSCFSCLIEILCSLANIQCLPNLPNKKLLPSKAESHVCLYETNLVHGVLFILYTLLLSLTSGHCTGMPERNSPSSSKWGQKNTTVKPCLTVSTLQVRTPSQADVIVPTVHTAHTPWRVTNMRDNTGVNKKLANSLDFAKLFPTAQLWQEFSHNSWGLQTL